MSAWAEMSPAEQRMVSKLERDQREIRLFGADAERILAEKQARKDEQEAWVVRNGLACFRCGTRLGPWAKGGRHDDGTPWVVCQMCVRRKP